jgi:hypothetical protein
MLPDKLLINLRILSKIQKNGRITKSNEGIINLENTALYKGIKRFLYNDSRKQSVFEINSIVEETSVTFNHLINNKYMNKSYQNTSEFIKNLEMINLLLKEVNDAKLFLNIIFFAYVSGLMLSYGNEYLLSSSPNYLLAKTLGNSISGITPLCCVLPPLMR